MLVLIVVRFLKTRWETVSCCCCLGALEYPLGWCGLQKCMKQTVQDTYPCRKLPGAETELLHTGFSAVTASKGLAVYNAVCNNAAFFMCSTHVYATTKAWSASPFIFRLCTSCVNFSNSCVALLAGCFLAVTPSSMSSAAAITALRAAKQPATVFCAFLYCADEKEGAL